MGFVILEFWTILEIMESEISYFQEQNARNFITKYLKLEKNQQSSNIE